MDCPRLCPGGAGIARRSVDTAGIAPTPGQADPGLRLRRKAARDGAPPHPPVGGPPLCGA